MANVADNLKADDVLLYISTNLTTPDYKVGVCLVSTGLNGSADVTAQSSRCGTGKARGATNWNLPFTLIANKNPGGTELSHEEMIALMISGDSFLWKIAHATTPADYYRQGQGFLSSYNETANDKEMLMAEGTIEVEGDPDITS